MCCSIACYCTVVSCRVTGLVPELKATPLLVEDRYRKNIIVTGGASPRLAG